VSQSLSRSQAIVLGLVVVLALGVTGVGLAQIATKQGLWADSFEVTVGFPDANDVAPGTPVRVRGVDAGQVAAVEYPDHDGPGSAVTVRLRLDAKFEGRLYADASAQIHSTGLLGGKVIAVNPGTPKAGPLSNGALRATEAPDLAKSAAQLGDAAGKIGATADETRRLVRDIRDGNGTLGKLIKDDELYDDLKGLSKDTRHAVARAEKTVTKVEGQVENVEKFVQDGRDTLRSVKQGTDAVQRMPLIRGYVEDAAALLVRPTSRREARPFHAAHLFEPGTAILHDVGREHLTNVAAWLKDVHHDKAELVVVAQCDPNDKSQTSASAAELTKKQGEVVIEFLKSQKAHKIGWWTRRPMTPVGLGLGPSPVVEPNPHPLPHVQVILFTPEG
jgi:phospholipid/cholesterol/gamma-HCH transport system substrate-binding protein